MITAWEDILSREIRKIEKIMQYKNKIKNCVMHARELHASARGSGDLEGKPLKTIVQAQGTRMGNLAA